MSKHLKQNIFNPKQMRFIRHSTCSHFSSKHISEYLQLIFPQIKFWTAVMLGLTWRLNWRTEINQDCTMAVTVTLANVKLQQIRRKQSDSQQLQHGRQEAALSDPHSSLMFLLLYTPLPRNPIRSYLSIRAPKVHRWTGRLRRDWKGNTGESRKERAQKEEEEKKRKKKGA